MVSMQQRRLSKRLRHERARQRSDEEILKSKATSDACLTLLHRLDEMATSVFNSSAGLGKLQLQKLREDMEGLGIVVSSSTVETPRASATLDNTTSSSPSHSSIAATPGLSSPKPNAFQALMKGRAGKLKPSSQPEKKKQRTGKLIAAGKSVMEGARKASVDRHNGKAVLANENAAKLFADSGCHEEKSHERMCTATGKAASNVLFTGDASRVKGNIRALLRRPEMREALREMGLQEAGNPKTKRQRAIMLCVRSLVNFAKVCLKTKGSRTLENQNTIDAAMASWVDQALFDQRLGREVGRLLQQEWRVLRKGARMHTRLANTKSWVRACKAEYRSQLGHASKMHIHDFLHSSEASYPDNANKGEVQVPINVDEDDNVVFVMHERRRHVGGWNLVLERFAKSDAWIAVKALWPEINWKATQKVIGEPKVRGPKTPLVLNRNLLMKCACRCTRAPGKPDETSCRPCSDLIANCRKYFHDRNQWYEHAGERRRKQRDDKSWVDEINPCSACG